MSAAGCDIIGEILYGSDLPFEAVDGVEASLREAVEDLLAGFDPVYVDFRVSGDGLGFLSALRECPADGLEGACAALSRLLDPQARGRMVVVTAGFGPVRVWTFTISGLDKPEPARKGGRKRG
jgi:hypothetical protein